MASVEQDCVRQTSSGATHRLVLLHGWGADMNDLIPLGNELLLKTNISWDLIALNAPQEHPSGIGRQWYGLFPSDWEAVPSAVQNLKSRFLDLLKMNNPQIPLEKTIVLGFSQGGAMALSLASELSFGCVISCSGYPHPDWRPSGKTQKIYLTHGQDDEIVPYAASSKIIESLKFENINYEVQEFVGGHSIPPEILPWISQKIVNSIDLQNR